MRGDVTRTQHNQTDERRARALTDDDVQALADEMEKRLANRFYGNIGRGLLGLFWKGFIATMLFVAAYGAAKGVFRQ